MEQENQDKLKKNGISIRLVLVLVMAVLLVIFTLQNPGKVSLKLFFWTIKDIPVALLIIVCLLLGYLIPYFALLSRIWKLKGELRQTRQEMEELEESVREEPEPKSKPDPEGIPFDDDEAQPVKRTDLSGRFFRD